MRTAREPFIALPKIGLFEATDGAAVE